MTHKFGISQPVRRREDGRLITGTGSFTDDVNVPGQARAVFLRSSHGHGLIRSIDAGAARKAPGVLAVMTGEDLRAAGVGYIDANTRAVFGRTYADEPGVLVKKLAADEAIAAADTLLLTVPNQLGVDYNAHAIESILKYVAPELGWR